MIGLIGSVIAFVCVFLGRSSRFFKISFWLVGLIIFWFSILYEIYKRKSKPLFNRIFLVGLVLTLIGGLSFLAIEGLIISEMASYPEAQPDVILVLGAGLWGDQPSTILKSRLTQTLNFSNGKDIPIVVSGGKGVDEWISEAEAMSIYLSERGIELDNIFLEKESTSTAENIKFSKELIKKQFGQVKVLIVTSDFHCYRAKFLAEKENMIVETLGAETIVHLKVNYMLREALAVIKDVLL